MASFLASQSLQLNTLWHQFRFLIVIACSLQLIACSSSKFISKQSSNLILSDSNFIAAHVGISIYDPSANKYLYEHQSDKYFIPASNTKLFTCYAAMKHLGDSLVAARIVEKDSGVGIIPTGDPSFLHPDFKLHSLYDYLKEQSKPIDIVRTTSSIENGRMVTKGDVLHTTPLGNGWAWNDYDADYMAERSNFPIYGNLVKFYMGAKNTYYSMPPFFAKQMSTSWLGNIETTGIDVTRNLNRDTFIVEVGRSKSVTLPFKTSVETTIQLLQDTLKQNIFRQGIHSARLPGDELKTIHSQPTDSILKPMMHRSDNFFAEQLLLMVSNEMTGVMNDAKIIDSLLKTDLKDLPQRPRWVDGSGLSRYNLFSPNDMVTVLNKMKNEFEWNRITTILATGGEGTLSSYYLHLKDRIFAKTGTLSNNIALSGFLITRQNNTLIFSVLVNNHMGNTTQIRKAVEKFLTSVADKY